MMRRLVAAYRVAWPRPLVQTGNRQAQCVLLTRLHSYVRSSTSSSRPARDLLEIKKEVQEALRLGRPVVALESTIISHGMPYPENLKTAVAVEDIVRSQGCTPATIAIIDGQIKVGLSEDDLETLARTGLKAEKTSRKDLALVLSQKKTGATTVSGTMLIAHMAGIKVFVTGGIGGVHRGAEESMDISADLTELGRTPVAVICAGVKSILDIGKTLEYLETQGVTVATYRSAEFPSFYSRSSGFKSPAVLQTTSECASLIFNNQRLGLQSGMVFACPIPEEHDMDGAAIEQAIQQALQQARDSSVQGKDVTPFLLDRVKKLTAGASLESNIALVKNNAHIGSQIARELSALASAGNSTPNLAVCSTQRPLIFGGSVMDISSKFDKASRRRSSENGVLMGTSSPGSVKQSLGGVGRNMAEACFRTGGHPVFVSVVGGDLAGQSIIRQMHDWGMDVDNISTEATQQTAVYSAFLDPAGEMLTAVADMKIHDSIPTHHIDSLIQRFKPGVVAFDGNLSVRSMEAVVSRCHDHSIPVLFEPTSIPKSTKVLELSIGGVEYATPNLGEVLAMGEFLSRRPGTSLAAPLKLKQLARSGMEILKAHPKLLPAILNVTRHIPKLAIKMGAGGVVVAVRDTHQSSEPSTQSKIVASSTHELEVHVGSERVQVVHIPVTKRLTKCVSVTGAGDSMVGTLITHLHRHPGGGVDVLLEGCRAGMAASLLSLQSTHAISEMLSPSVFSAVAR
ncbi:Indigoidine synthase A like protein-domain-containing protein [Polychytrium aggregatum]|uniref:Indigoidine synthase A like protein-domain-containing protein n=1 Tax=Polychytrium aggregatum TaxID=110093 RepID=UPI0022FEB486|nr:Indigoidine synthase A like protein-domain-containing protein [Polychytrium aggregatum]KAI9204804.1 Indigoidine synthase A like protein-domain-containing protein [Polychytrium aggregatum]